MSMSRVILICSAAILAMVVALPMTRWVVLNHVDVLAGRYDQSLSGNWASIAPDLGPQIKQIKSVDLDSQFVVAWRQGPSELLELARQHPNEPTLFAHTVRLALNKGNFDAAKRAAILGQRADPNNAYFPLVLAAIAQKHGDTPAAHAALEQASKAVKFDGYMMDHGDRETRARESQFGYRGQYVRVMSYSGIILPEYSYVTALSDAVQKQEDLEPRRHLAKTGVLLVKSSETLIGMLIGRRMVEASVFTAADKRGRGTMAERKALVRQRAEERDQQSKTTEFGTAADRSSIVYELYADLPDDSWIWNRSSLIFGASALAALAIAVLTSLVAGRLGGRETGPGVDRAMPHLLAFSTWLIAQYGLTLGLVNLGSEAESIVGLLMLLHLIIAAGYAESRTGRHAAVIAASIHALISMLAAIPYVPIALGIGLAAATIGTLVGLKRLSPQRRNLFGVWVGALACLFALMASSGAAVAWIPAAAFLLGLLATRAKLALPALVVLIGGLGLLVVELVRFRSDPWLSLVGLGLGLVAIAFYWRKPLTASPYAPAVIIASATMAYVGFIGAELGQDARDGVLLENYLNEADRLREKAADSRLP